jgi:deoxyribonuclease V
MPAYPHAGPVHGWDVSPEQAMAIQDALRARVQMHDAQHAVHVVAGVDNAYVRQRDENTLGIGVAVALSFPRLEPLDSVVITRNVSFPYIPGLLAFREVPLMLAALAGLRVSPDVVLVDAHGYAHPRRFGAASHLGVLIDVPTIGCAKSNLVGGFKPLGSEAGAESPLLDEGETIGMVVRGRPGCAPVWVSVGHRISLTSAVQLVLACYPVNGRSRLPEPLRMADARTKYEAQRLRVFPRHAQSPSAPARHKRHVLEESNARGDVRTR